LVGVTMDGLQTKMYLKGIPPYDNRIVYPFPEILLLDFQMPGYTGLEVLASMRGMSRRPKTILWSDALDLINQARAYELGATLVCQKPTLPSEVRNILMTVQKYSPAIPTAARPSSARSNRTVHAAGAVNWLAAAQCGA
jgi:DNA-binding response OmpR family regulator